MAGKIGDAYVEVGARLGPFQKAMNSVQKRFQRVGAGLARIGKRAAIGFGLALAAGTAYAIKAAAKQERVEAQLAAVLKSTGYAAGFSADQIKKQAAELQQLTGIGDEAIISTQSMIATFKGIKGDNFKRTTEAVLDMATIMNGGVATQESMRSSAVQLGKALNDPIANMGALGRVGIQFDEATKENIKSLTEQGRLMEAQNIILKEVESEFGGVAKATGKTTAGAFNLLKSNIGDAFEEIGKMIGGSVGLRDMLKSLSDKVLVFIEKLKELAASGWVEEMVMRVKLFWNNFSATFKQIWTIGKGVVMELVNLWKWQVNTGINLFKNLVEGIQTLFKNLKDNIFAIFKAIWHKITHPDEEFVMPGMKGLFAGAQFKKIIAPPMKAIENMYGDLEKISAKHAQNQLDIEDAYRKNMAEKLKGKPAGAAIIPGEGMGEGVTKKTAKAETFAFSEAWKKLQQAAADKKDRQKQLDIMKKQLTTQEATQKTIEKMAGGKAMALFYATGA